MNGSHRSMPDLRDDSRHLDVEGSLIFLCSRGGLFCARPSSREEGREES